MKEKPILFNGAMVRAILAGKKTQTCRIVKPQPLTCLQYHEISWDSGYWGYPGCNLEIINPKYNLASVPEDKRLDRWIAPFHSMDCLYVRETYATLGKFPDGHTEYWYKADYPDFPEDYPEGWEFPGEVGNTPDRWRPSIHMPKEASRIKLLVKSVDCCRICNMTPGQIRAEGIDGDTDDAALQNFRAIWELCYGEKSYAANPFVWRIEFARIEANQ